jgi:hypothetical protein
VTDVGATSLEDPFEELFARGVTDGLPVVPPTRARVEAAIAASGRPRDELIALVAPALGRATVERIAVNAVMAGCRPEYMPVVIAGVEALCDEGFSLVGISGTTDAIAPVFIVNGPVRGMLGINSGAGALGPGYRANATIGRALRLVWVNLGGARAGAITMSTFGNPGRFACCFGEHEEASPWPPLHVEHGFAADDSTVAALPGEPLQAVVDGQSQSAADVLDTVARSLEVVASHRTASLGDTLLLVSPMHARTIAADGWSKADVRRYLWDRLEARRQGPAPKFRAPEHLKLVVAGGAAGPFTALIPGWPFADSPSRLVLKKISAPTR